MRYANKIKSFADVLLPWFLQNERQLPWREARTPYRVWISEVMLQQTQVDRGIGYFQRWMERFPSVRHVADASEEEILHAWEGLGYYSRARHIHKAAKQIMEEHGGVFPSDIEAIRALPGIGPYTTGAIASMAFGHKLPCIDANVERVLARIFDIDSPVKQEPAASYVRALALELALATKDGHIQQHNEALMELGALVCRKKPLCVRCPMQAMCESYRLGIVQERPVPGRKAVITPLHVVTGVLWDEGEVFVQKRLPEGVWASLWEFPGGRIEAGESPEQAVVREFAEETGFDVEITHIYPVIKHGYTTYRITLHCFGLALRDKAPRAIPRLTAATEYQWLSLDALRDFAMPAAHRKLADTLVVCFC